jgi:hypothetical protein
VYDLTAQQFGLRLAGLVLLIAVQGGAVAAVAVLLGDRGPRHDGRLTLNPVAHLDLLGLLSGLVFSLLWTKPVAVDPAALRGGRAALVAVVLGPFVAVLALVPLLGLLRRLVLPLLSDTLSQSVFALIDVTDTLCLWCALVNLLPLPPFVGAQLLTALGLRWTRLQGAAGFVVLVLAAAGLVGTLLAPAESVLAGLLLRS